VRYSIDQPLPRAITLVHGPGCPVCVTPVEYIDAAIEIARRPGDPVFVRRDAARAGQRGRNRTAQNMIRDAFRIIPRRWREIREIPASGLALTEANADFDAEFGNVGHDSWKK